MREYFILIRPRPYDGQLGDLSWLDTKTRRRLATWFAAASGKPTTCDAHKRYFSIKSLKCDLIIGLQDGEPFE